MRWDEQAVEREEEGRLPGIGPGTVVRTFDAPEAMGINFHEVRAKSALNHVPGMRFGFNHTINAFRGCTHACAYCLDGDTPILMADGRYRRLAEIGIGDRVYGTTRVGRYRRYVKTEVLAHWQTRKQSYRVTLEDGTELVASGDHRFLTDRGWKHVVGTECGRSRRPHLTLNNRLLGIGGYGDGPVACDEYRRGYLCGMIRGDGHLGSYSYKRPGRAHGDVHRFRLALADLEALDRSATYLAQLGVRTDRFPFYKGSASRRPLAAIRTSARSSVEQVRRLIDWPQHPSESWSRGFLAGIFDAEGSCNGVIRISNKDREILGRTNQALDRIGVRAIDESSRPNGVATVRVVGGLPEQQKFFNAVNPAISRKRSVVGTAVKANAPLRVAGVEPLPGMRPLYDITTGTGDFVAAGVISHNCFARRTHTYLDFNAGRDFEREIVVKVNVPEVLRAELARPSWKRELVALGTNTDPYQWAESRYRFMPEIIAALRESGTPISVLTKSPLVLRDIDLYAEMAEELDVTVNMSVPTLDEKAWRATEPHTPHPRARLEAVAELKARGIGSGVLIAPLMPGINDSPEQVEPLVRMAREAGADFLGGVALHLRDEVRDVFFGWLRAKRPDLLPMYEQLYPNRRAYLIPEERKRVQSVVRGWGRNRRRRQSSRDREAVGAGGTSRGDRPEHLRRGGGPRGVTGPAPPPSQERLF